eukprot:1191053-Prorocentrum_minimum.AAC.2
MFSRWTNQTHEARAYSHDGPIRARPTAASAPPTWTNRTQGARTCSHDGPIRRMKRGHILTTDQSEPARPPPRRRPPGGSTRVFSRRTNQKRPRPPPNWPMYVICKGDSLVS